MILGSILILYLTIAWAKQIHWFARKTNVYWIEFENVNGLKTIDPVLMRGVEIGSVLSFQIQQQKVAVQIQVKEEFPVPEGSIAEIQIKEILGGKQISIEPGSGSPLPSGSKLTGKPVFDFTIAFSRFGEFFLSQDPAQWKVLVARLDTLTKIAVQLADPQSPNNIPATLASLQTLTQDLSLLLSEAKQEKLIPQLSSTLQETKSTLQETQKTMIPVRELSQSAIRFLPKADSLSHSAILTLQHGDSLVLELRSLLTELKTNPGLANKMLRDKEFADQILFTIENLNQTLSHIRSKKVRVGFTFRKE